MNKFILVLMFTILILPLVASAPPVKTIVSGQTTGLTISPNLVNYVPQNSIREWEIHALNDSKLITSGLTCTIHIYEEQKDGGHIYFNSSSTFMDVYDIEIISPASITAVKGQYSFKAYCNTSSQAGLYEGTYYVTKSGNPPADDITTTFIWLLFIASVLLLFYTFFLMLAKLVTADVTVYDVLLSWSGFILMIIVNYLSEEYLIRTYVENLTATLLSLTVWTNGVLPIIAFIITMFIKSTMKKKPLSPQEIGGFRYG